MTDLPVFTRADLDSLPRVDLPAFGHAEAHALGTIAAALIVERGLDLAVDIVTVDDDDLVFRAKLGATGPGNDEWLAGKAATARAFGVPSLAVRRRIEDGDDAAAGELQDHMKPHGGAIPLFVDGELVATITMSGEPDVIDHATAAEAVARYIATL